MLLMLRAAMKHAQRCYTDVGHQKHIRRVQFQAMIWKQAHLTTSTLQLPETMGWLRLKDKIVPKLMSLAPVPDTFDEMVNCDCESRREYKKNQR